MAGSKQPLVSVIVPAYNHAQYVRDAIKSIINQTYENIELIIIDDGSTDSTFKKLQAMETECKKRFVRVFFETKQNEGTCATYNKLLELSKGEYIFDMSSDDIIKPNTIDEEVNFLEINPEYALCVGDNEIIDSEGKRCYWDKNRNNVYSEKEAKYLTFGDLLKSARKDVTFTTEQFGSYDSLVRGNYIPNGYLIRRSIFEKIGLFTQKAPLEDWWLMLQISKYAKLKYIDKIMFSYRWHGTNTIKQIHKMQLYSYATRIYEYKTVKHNKKLVKILSDKYGKIIYFEKNYISNGGLFRINIRYAIPKKRITISFGKH